MKEMLKEIIKTYMEKLDIGKTVVLLTVCASFLGTNYALAFVAIPVSNEMVFTHFAGVIDASMVGVISWYFGSSKGSQKKTEMIDKMTDK